LKNGNHRLCIHHQDKNIKSYNTVSKTSEDFGQARSLLGIDFASLFIQVLHRWQRLKMSEERIKLEVEFLRNDILASIRNHDLPHADQSWSNIRRNLDYKVFRKGWDLDLLTTTVQAFFNGYFSDTWIPLLAKWKAAYNHPDMFVRTTSGCESLIGSEKSAMHAASLIATSRPRKHAIGQAVVNLVDYYDKSRSNRLQRFQNLLSSVPTSLLLDSQRLCLFFEDSSILSLLMNSFLKQIYFAILQSPM
jgi:hypothetical protein